ncbi:MAG: P-loop containing nucleoside triphosphate hydrolase protein [Benjaminiella poitrasii]|nr:MAG: P-loop containing nucleoside triphosphate hydrolase protein [Benjaminiella poitrasii]
MSRRRIQSDSESDDESSSAKRTKLDHSATQQRESDVESEDDRDVSIVDNPEINDILLDEQSDNTVPLAVDEDDGFVEGSIVKITLVNFVTYDYCEIYPGPQMNMIIGPNGTGKSTIVCAIALGLGGNPALLGRAKNIAEFVKTGEDEATITIELKRINVRNVVIQRSFKKSNNVTTWRLDGKTTTQKEVMSLIYSFNIQVDNLCQFLPQDRVAEFAELSPSQLLERTQTAAGKSDLHNMQKQLVEWREKEKDLIEVRIMNLFCEISGI